MAIRRVDLKNHYSSGEIWSDAGNETEALQEAREWCDLNPPWELHVPEPVQGDDGHYKFEVERVFAL